MSFSKICVLATALLVASVGSSQTLDRVLAIVNQEVVLQSDLQNRLSNLQQQQAGTRLPANVEEQVLEQLVVESLQMQRAEQMGIRIEQAQLENALSNLARRNNLSLSQFAQALGNDFANVREEIRRQLTIQRLHQQIISQEVTVGEREIDQYLASLAGQAALPKRYLLSYSRFADEQQAEAVREQLQDGAKITELGLSDVRDLGWREPEQIPSLFAQWVPGLGALDSTPVVAQGGAFHLVQVMDVDDLLASQHQEYRVRHLLLRSDIRAAEEARAISLQLYRQLTDGADFAELAREYSEDQSSEQGGLLPWAQLAGWVPEFADPIRVLRPGQISQPFESRFGWHIARVEDTRAASNTDEILRDQVRQMLGEQKSQQALEQWLMELRAEAFIDVKG